MDQCILIGQELHITREPRFGRCKKRNKITKPLSRYKCRALIYTTIVKGINMAMAMALIGQSLCGGRVLEGKIVNTALIILNFSPTGLHPTLEPLLFSILQ